MNCPSCNHPLKLWPVTGVKVRACEGSCGGLWFDWNEIKKLKDRNAGAGASLLQVERADGVHIFRNIHHPCPKCVRTLLYRHCFSKPFGYEVDQCAKCAGFWVDTGTLAGLPHSAPTESDRQQAAAYFKNLFEKSLKPENLTHPDAHEAAQTVIHIFRFLTPPDLFPAERSR